MCLLPALCDNSKSSHFFNSTHMPTCPRQTNFNNAYVDRRTRKRHAKSNHASAAIGDSGTTHNLLRASHAKNLDVTPCSNLHVTLPNGASITSTHVGKLPLPNTQGSTPFYVFSDNDLQHSLLSFSALCNEHNCVITLTSTDVYIRQGAIVLFHGTKSRDATLWHIDLEDFRSVLPHATCNNAYKTDTDAEFVAFVHASFGYPTFSTFLNAVSKGWLKRYPRLTAPMVSANQPHAIATAKGHLDQTRQVKKSRTLKHQHQYSTNVSLATPPEEDYFDDPDICVKTYDLKDPIHADLTGRFPIVSLKGNQYLLVACWHGYFHFELMASRKADCYVQAYTRLLAFFRGLGRNPSFLRLDNETSGKLEAYLKSEKVGMQFVPPGVHRANKAERAIRTSKNHIISMLCGAHADFDLKLWDESIEQAELTLNHLVPYALDPTLSAYDGLHPHPYDFLAHPIAPFGTLVVVHEKPADRGTWDPHGVKGWYLGPAVQHHHCWRTWIIHTQAARITDTVEWFPSPLKLPGRSPHAMVAAALHDLVTAVKAFPNNEQISRAQLNTHVATATEALRAVIDLFEPQPVFVNNPMVPVINVAVHPQRVSAPVDHVDLQRVSDIILPVPAPESTVESILAPTPILRSSFPYNESNHCLQIKPRGRPKGVPKFVLALILLRLILLLC